MDVVQLTTATAFITKDGSEIRELLAHRNSCIRHQSLAEARIPVGSSTTPHYHPKTEEIYFILEGAGLMRIGEEKRLVGPGDAIAIPPGSVHELTNVGASPLRLLCCCAPGYEHDDTVLMETPRLVETTAPIELSPTHESLDTNSWIAAEDAPDDLGG